MPNLPQQLLSESARDAATQLTRIAQDSGASDVGSLLDRWALPVFAQSPYLADVSARYPQLVLSLIESGELQCSDSKSLSSFVTWFDVGLVERFVAEESAEELFVRQLAQLRQLRNKGLFRILWRDLTGVADLDETLMQLSLLADACIVQSWEWAHEAMLNRYGEPVSDSGNPQRLVVLGMGKLGGFELNVSSDIDLIYAYPEPGQTDGERSIDSGDFFTRVAQRLTQLLGKVTEDGFVYRVDTRLRPFGDSGPLVMNMDGLENYYLTQGRDWERYAMIKARPVAGDPDSCDELMDLLQPFVYRRYLDYSAIESLAELKRKITLSVEQRGMERNIKLGAGGIREIEFIAQAFQLVRGGREKKLQHRSLQPVLGVLAEMELLSSEDAQALKNAYVFLRRLENGVQLMRDQQKHELPDDEDDQLRLTAIMGFDSWDGVMQELSMHQALVSTQFQLVFADVSNAETTPSELDEALDKCERAWAVFGNDDLPEADRSASITELGFTSSEELIDILSSFCFGGFYQRLTARGQERIDKLLPRLLVLSLQQSNPNHTLLRSVAFARAVAGRSGYVQVLLDRPPALDRLVSLFGKSAWVAQFVTSHPIVIDELLALERGANMPGPKDLASLALAEANRLQDADLEQQMDGLRQFEKSQELRIAVAELDDDLPLMQVSDQLTWLAEAVIAAVMKLVMHPLLERHGKPQCMLESNLLTPEIGIVAYGKLGGVELGYGSDLDLVFVHNSRGEKQVTDGPKPIDNSTFYARFAQRMVSFMNTMTSTGVLYEIDLRLRPNGQSGVLVTGLASFEQYQTGDAWTWEHQALVRARMVVGSQTLVEQFQAIRASVLRTERDNEQLMVDVTDMRQRMLASQNPPSVPAMHLKQSSGGITDIEFMVQYLVLSKACEHGGLLEFTDNMRLLEIIRDEQILPSAECHTLMQCYLLLRARAHRQALQEESPVVALDDELQATVDQVRASWTKLFSNHKLG